MRSRQNFEPVVSTAPSFRVGATNVFTSTATAFESTAIGRVWQGPGGRAVRVGEENGRDYYVNFGSSLIAANATDSILILGGTVETFSLRPSDSYIAIKSVSTSTGAVVNVTIGYGN